MRTPFSNFDLSAERKRNCRTRIALLALLALGACSSGSTPPPSCKGAVRQLNPDRWQATPNDLVESPPQRSARLAGCPEPILAAIARGGATS